MSLVSELMTNCQVYEKTRVSDGEGGFTTTWTPSKDTSGSDILFKAAITFDTSVEARIAQAQGVTSRYTVTTQKNVDLQYYDVFKRISDSKFFRVTSDGDDKQTPTRASFQFLQVTAEEWSLPT